jgi:hypothetical protein
VAERLNAAVLKTVGGGDVARGFESPPFRFRRVGDSCSNPEAHVQGIGHAGRVPDEPICERQASPQDLPGTARMIEVARLKARAPIALGDCFALATAAAHDLVLLTGDPEIIELSDRPCQVEDLRPLSN